MITAKIKIGDGEVKDSRDFGLVYLDSDKRLAADTKGFESISYPEEPGENILPKTVDDAFDYTIKFFIDPSVLAGSTDAEKRLQTANGKVQAFNNSLFDYELDEEGQPTGVKVYKQVEFYNTYKRHKIVGYPKPIAEPEKYWRDPSGQINDVVVVEWLIRVSKPQLCDFNYDPTD